MHNYMRYFRFDPSDAGVVFSVSDYVFEVTCQDGGTWPSSIAWPNCIVDECVAASIPDLAANNFSVVDSKDVKVGEKLQYQCVDSSQVREWAYLYICLRYWEPQMVCKT